MFTGIVATTALIERAESVGSVLRLTLSAAELDLSDVALGDSIAHNGVCLTVIQRDGGCYQVELSSETLACTVGLDQVGARVNVEKALRLADRLGGHLVSGHVDGVGMVLEKNVHDSCVAFVVQAPQALAPYIASKGSITVNGVSLTTNRVRGDCFELMLIPHTLEITNLGELEPGSRVNLEVDLIARYCQRLLEASGQMGQELPPGV